MAQRLLDGLRVLDLGGDPSARAGRVLGDLGADVVRVVPPAGDPLAGNVARAWNAGKQVIALAADDAALDSLLADADVVFDELGAPGHAPTRSGACTASGVGAHLPFGGEGPRAGLERAPTSA